LPQTILQPRFPVKREAVSWVAQASACGLFVIPIQNRRPLATISRTLILRGLTRLRNARIPSTISLCVSLDSFCSTGISNATGAPYRVIVIFSPRATRLRSSEKRALASIAFTVPMVTSLRLQVYNFPAQVAMFESISKVHPEIAAKIAEEV
jgi:hypothetical protein